MVQFCSYRDEDYEALCTFLLALNERDRGHIHWNWARLEWMIAHPMFEKALAGSMGLWRDDGKVVGAALYDQYPGEGFCGVLPGWEALYPEVLEYACRELADENGFALAIRDDSAEEIQAAEAMGFSPIRQSETLLRIPLNGLQPSPMPEGLHMEAFDPAREPERFQWILWQGFDHGSDRKEFLEKDPVAPQHRPHLTPELSIAAVTEAGKDAAYCCVWYDPRTDYAYVEPVCTIPEWRGRGAGRAVLTRALYRAHTLGAKEAWVISEQPFYEKLGFEKTMHFTFFARSKD